MRGAASHFYVLWLNLRKHDLFFLRFFKMVSLCWYEAGFCVSSFMNIVYSNYRCYNSICRSYDSYDVIKYLTTLMIPDE